MQKARFDWLAELCGAGALAAASGYAALKVAPSFGFAAPMAMTAAGFAGFALGALAMRLAKPGARSLPISEFALPDLGFDPTPVRNGSSVAALAVRAAPAMHPTTNSAAAIRAMRVSPVEGLRAE